MAQQISSKPIRKVAAGALAGATITVIVFVIKSLLKTDVPADVASALTVLLTFGMIASWMPLIVGVSSSTLIDCEPPAVSPSPSVTV